MCPLVYVCASISICLHVWHSIRSLHSCVCVCVVSVMPKYKGKISLRMAAIFNLQSFCFFVFMTRCICVFENTMLSCQRCGVKRLATMGHSDGKIKKTNVCFALNAAFLPIKKYSLKMGSSTSRI